jgi:hypothetical protein
MSKTLIYFTVLRLLEGSRRESAAEHFGSTGFIDCLAIRIGSIVALGFKELVGVPTSATLEAASGPESLPEDIVKELLQNCGIV